MNYGGGVYIIDRINQFIWREKKRGAQETVMTLAEAQRDDGMHISRMFILPRIRTNLFVS